MILLFGAQKRDSLILRVNIGMKSMRARKTCEENAEEYLVLFSVQFSMKKAASH